MNKKIELLSPAKNLELGKTAINFGADAVYIGASEFGARSTVGNSVKDIEKLSKYAHKFNAKVYVALNTILYENELKKAEKLIHQIYNTGADALIIQDMGILEMNLPPIALHASTQAHNINAEKVAFLEKTGFKRVILARELSLKNIAEIHSKTNIELEAFIHGALCVSYSGQCYMSSYIGGRSGNRGECAQPCRLKYDLLDDNNNSLGKNKHWLSIKDMNRSHHISKMIEDGIVSLKIEGRLKDLNYLKNVTAYYRKKIDNFLEQRNGYKRPSSGVFYFNFDPDLEKTFNRQFTDYFLTGRKSKISSGSPKSAGKFLGAISFVGKNYFIIDTTHKINNGDGLCYYKKNGELIGCGVNKVKSKKVFVNQTVAIETGTKIYRNNDFSFNKKLSVIDNARFINIDAEFNETESGFELILTTENVSVHKEIKIKKELAKNESQALENINNQLKKTGGTIFKLKYLEINLSKAYFLPISIINTHRRVALDELFLKLGENYHREEFYLKKNEEMYFHKTLDYKANISNLLAEKFYNRHGVEHIEKAFEILDVKENKTVMTTKFCLKYELGQCEKYQKPIKKASPKYLKLHDKIFTLEFDCDNCVMKINS